MQVFVNQEPKSIEQDTNISLLLNELLNNNLNGIAIAINNDVISKSKWEETILNENDKITIITASQGG